MKAIHTYLLFIIYKIKAEKATLISLKCAVKWDFMPILEFFAGVKKEGWQMEFYPIP
jgi:hypothetical protein